MTPTSPFRKGLLWDMLPKDLGIDERFRLAGELGFEGLETPSIKDPEEARRMRASAAAHGLRIHSVIYGGWHLPLSHPDAETRERGVEDVQAALHSAHNLGADNILLVPAVVNAQTGYRDAYERSQQGIRRLLPVAERLRIQILVENVWNNFLLSPLEFGAYVDAFDSPWVQAYFDVGNVAAFAWPQDWIRTLGPRIGKVHVKDFKGGPGLFGVQGSKWANLREGSIDWPEVHKALGEIGYQGFVTVELGGGDAAYLRDISERMDQIFAGL